MQQALMLLRRTSKSLSIEDLAKLLNAEEGGENPPESGEGIPHEPPAEGEVVQNPETEVVPGEGSVEVQPQVVEGEAPSESVPSEPAPSEPTPSEPTPSEPTPSEPASSEPQPDQQPTELQELS